MRTRTNMQLVQAFSDKFRNCKQFQFNWWKVLTSNDKYEHFGSKGPPLTIPTIKLLTKNK